MVWMLESNLASSSDAFTLHCVDVFIPVKAVKMTGGVTLAGSHGAWMTVLPSYVHAISSFLSLSHVR